MTVLKICFDNSPNGEKADVIEDLDPFDRVRILGGTTEKISVAQASAHGLNGLGIFADGVLEAVYTGGDRWWRSCWLRWMVMPLMR